MRARQPLTGDPAIGLDAAARQILNGYLDRLADHLSGPLRNRQAILAEAGTTVARTGGAVLVLRAVA